MSGMWTITPLVPGEPTPAGAVVFKRPIAAADLLRLFGKA